MKIIFPADPINDKVVDSMFIDEVAAATRAGLAYEIIDYNAIERENNAARAVTEIPVHSKPEAAIYRGWMLRAQHYATLYDALLSRGLRLITTAKQYTLTHHLPESLSVIKKYTPRTVYMATDARHLDYDAIMETLLPFAGQPLILKDYVKSEKHYWNEACYISSSTDKTAVQNTIERFLELRGDEFEGGLVFREFVNLQPLSEHPRSGMPLTKEYRIFVVDGKPIITVRYWDIDGYTDEDAPPIGLFAPVMTQVRSRFYTMDVAQRLDGEWIIVELGDGQVAGLPQSADENALYHALAAMQ